MKDILDEKGDRMMNRKYAIGFVGTVGVLMMVISGCCFVRMDNHAKEYDDDAKLKSDAGSYSYTERLGNVGRNEADLKFDFSGNDVLWEIETDRDCTLSGNYDIVISKGDFKIISVSPMAEITKVWEMEAGDNYGNLDIPLKKGMNRIKIVGKRAQGAMKMRLNPSGDTMKITPHEHL